MRRFCWRERSEKLNWRLLGVLDVADVVRRGDPSLLEQYALHITFARLPKTLQDPTTRDAWFLVRVMQLAMEYLLFMRARDGDVLDSLTREMRQLETERDELVLRAQKWEKKTRSGEKQVEKLHQVLQNIAKLLQIHGASPSAVATIETLLSELIVERRARQKKRKLVETGDEMDDRGPTVREARVCGFCGKLFSSAEYLEKHLVRRHGGERVEVETPGKLKMRRNFAREEDDKENKGRNEDAGEVMQKMMQQVERALNDHEEKMRSLAEGEAAKVQQIYELLHAEITRAEEMRVAKRAEEMKVIRVKAEEEHEERRQLDEVCLQLKEKAEDDLEDLKQQIQFLTLKKNMMGSVGLPGNLPPRSNNALLAAESEIKDLQHTLEAVNRELASSRQELAKVQALHLSALKKKKELADKLASSREVSAVALQENSSQTEQPVVINGSVQTDEQVRPLQFESEKLSEPCAPAAFEDAGTDALILSYADVGIQTVEFLQAPSVDGEVQVTIIDDPVPTPTATTDHLDPDLASQEPSREGNDDQFAEVAPSQPDVHKEDDGIPDYIQQIHIQDLLNALIERAQSAASKASIEALQNPVSKDCSSISRHKYVRSRFQHGEDVVKERVASCHSQLGQFSRRFGVPAKSALLSDENMQIVQQALHGHLEVMPTDVLAKMVDCETAVNAIIEKEWMLMGKTRQQALERFKMEARAKSEISRRQVMVAAFGDAAKSNQRSEASSSNGVTADAPANTDESSCESEGSENEAKKLPIDRDPEVPVVTSARRYSAKNTLTVVVEGEALREGTTYLADELAESDITEGERAISPEVRETLDYLVENTHREDEVSNLDENLPNVNTYASDHREDDVPKFEENLPNVSPDASDLRSLQVSHDIASAVKSPREDSEPVAANILSEKAELSGAMETRPPGDSSSNGIGSIRVDAVPDDMRLPSWETSALSRSHSEELSSPEPVATSYVQNDSVLSFDDSDIEEVLLT